MADKGRPKTGSGKKRHLEVMEFRVTGNHFHQDDLMKLAVRNKRKRNPEGYDRVFKYYFKHDSIELYEEFNDPNGINGIKVFVDGLWVGIVPPDISDEVREILHSGEVKYISCWITGGPCTLYLDGKALNREDRMIAVSVKIGYAVEE